MLRLTALALGIAAMLCGCDRISPEARHGIVLIEDHGCGACHTIPGVPDATGKVGPPLSQIGSQAIIGGMLPNTEDNLIKWIRTPQSVVPGNAMPNTELSDHDARDIAAYLQTLR
ncbi:MAG TPA: c-type cytochrome [Alphaproteobacteria bacterium]|jgi:cytochrome c1|nr:c-type cytochrome [Alphaproteobacteria bacterium]